MNDRKFPAFEAMIFDLDGVVTKTAVTHTAAWKKTFDEYLRKREQKQDEPFREFTQDDYLSYVDGKPRYEGVASFLDSRNIDIPWGSPDDSADAETVCGIGNRKNKAFNEMLKKEGTEVYPSTKKLLIGLKNAGVKLGVASSSKNCKAILEAVHLQHLFGARVDGVVSEELKLNGKPEPDIFTKACEMLDTLPSRSIVAEDAVSGVQAGMKGGFGLTLGIARKDNADELRRNGANFVVSDLEEVNGVTGLNEIFLKFRRK